MANNYAWWVGQDNNIWANVNGNVQKISAANRSDDGNILGMGSYGKIAGTLDQPGIIKLYAANQIADPNAPQNQATNGTGSYEYSGRGGGSGSGSSAQEEAIKANMRNIYDRQIGDINNNINSLQGQLDNSLAGIKNEYDTYKNEQQSTYNANKNTYDQNTLQNQKDLRKNKNAIMKRASAGLRSLLGMLGAMGAGGGTEARYTIPGMVTRQANEEFNNAGSTFRENQQNLDTDWGNYNNQFENDKKKLEDWYNGQVKSKKQEIEERKQSLLADLVTAYGNRAQYGGDFGANINDTYNKIAESRNKINELGKFTPTKYTGMTAVYNAPELSSYDAGDTKIETSVKDTGADASPVLVALQGLAKKKSTNPYSNRTEA